MKLTEQLRNQLTRQLEEKKAGLESNKTLTSRVEELESPNLTLKKSFELSTAKTKKKVQKNNLNLSI
jgi:hypothetical protein